MSLDIFIFLNTLLGFINIACWIIITAEYAIRISPSVSYRTRDKKLFRWDQEEEIRKRTTSIENVDDIEDKHSLIYSKVLKVYKKIRSNHTLRLTLNILMDHGIMYHLVMFTICVLTVIPSIDAVTLVILEAFLLFDIVYRVSVVSDIARAFRERSWSY